MARQHGSQGGGFGRNTPNRGQRRDSKAPAATALPVTFYKIIDGDKRVLSPTLLDTDAEKQAELLRTRIKSTQIRKFFGDVKNMYLRLQQGRNWQELEPLFRMLKSKAYYASKSGSSRIPDEFRAFITDNVDRVKDEKDFEAFVMYFEAVLGFAYGKGLVQNN